MLHLCSMQRLNWILSWDIVILAMLLIHVLSSCIASFVSTGAQSILVCNVQSTAAWEPPASHNHAGTQNIPSPLPMQFHLLPPSKHHTHLTCPSNESHYLREFVVFTRGAATFTIEVLGSAHRETVLVPELPSRCQNFAMRVVL